MEEIQEMSHKKKRFEKDITSLESFAVDFAVKAESNALRRTAKEKEKSVKEIDELLQEKYKELAN